MNYPKIGIVGKHFGFQGEMDHAWNDYIVTSGLISDLVNKFGGVVISVTPIIPREYLTSDDKYYGDVLSDEEKKKIDIQIDGLDGIILQGGIQTSPAEEYIASQALKKKIPIMGICAGFNNILRAAGGKTITAETNEHDFIPEEIAHKIEIMPGSNLHRLIGEKEVLVNSIHTQIARPEDIPDRFIISAKSPDGMVEAFEAKDGSPVFGYKWHPELMAKEGINCYNPAMNNLFQDFIIRCREYKEKCAETEKSEKAKLQSMLERALKELESLQQGKGMTEPKGGRVEKF